MEGKGKKKVEKKGRKKRRKERRKEGREGGKGGDPLHVSRSLIMKFQIKDKKKLLGRQTRLLHYTSM